MYCNNCGAYIEDNNAHFCQSCGAPVNFNQNTNENNNAYPQSQAYSEPMKDTQDDAGNKKKAVIVAVSAVVSVAIICAAVICGFLFSSGKGDSASFDELKAGVRAQVTDVPESDHIEMRDSAAEDSEVTQEIREGEYVDILADYNSENDGYIFVRYLNDRDYSDGWVPAEFLEKVSLTDDYKTLKKDARCKVLSQSADEKGTKLYKEPSLESEVIVDVPEADYVIVLEDYNKKNGEFLFVEYTGESETYEGWILGQCLEFDSWYSEPVTEQAEQETEKKLKPKFEEGDVCIIDNNTPYHDGVTLRSKADYNSSKVRVIAEGEYVIVLSDYNEQGDNGYVYCFYDDGYDAYTGWIKAKFMAYVTSWNGNHRLYYNAIGGYDVPEQTSTTFYEGGPGSSDYKNFEEGDYCYVGYETVGHDGLNLRSGPSSDSTLLMVVGEGTDAYVLKDYSSSDNGYIKVKVYGQTGYLKGKYLVYNGTSNTEPATTTTEEPDTTYEPSETEPSTEATTTEITTTETTTEATTTTQAPTEPSTEIIVETEPVAESEPDPDQQNIDSVEEY